MEVIDGMTCISFEELTGRIITTANLNNLVRRGRVQQVRKGGNGRAALYAVESLPLKWRTEVYKRFPDLQEQAESKDFVDTVEPDGAAFAYYQAYKLSDGRNLPEDKVLEYASNVAIMNAFRRLIEASNSHRARQSRPKLNKSEFWKRAAAALPRLADTFPHSLPGSPRRLQMKFAEYVAEGYDCFISGKFQNNNAGKVVADEQGSYLMSLIEHPNNIPDTKIAALYNAMGKYHDWEPITAATVAVWRERNRVAAQAGRLGTTNFRNRISMQAKRSRPTAPFLMWSLDGWTVELLYQETKQDKKGHNVTTYTNRLTMVVVLDPFNDYPIGYAVGTHESPALIKEALRNAAKHSRELVGEMLRAYQVQSDRYAIKTMHDIYSVMGKIVIPAQAHNAKAKPVEPYFNHLNTTYCILCNNWSGFGITTNPKRQPNSEALNKKRHHFPDEAGVRAQIDEMMKLERRAKYQAFIEGMGGLKPQHRLPLSREMYLLNFGAETGFKNVLEGCGLRPTILGVKRDYDCFDLTFREHGTERWTVKYDPDDLTQVLAVSENGQRRYMLEQKYVQPMALADRKEGDAEQLERVREYNRQLEARTAERIALDYRRTEQLIAATPALRGSIEDRLLITDSRGQHKDRRSAKRLSAADIEAIEVETVEVFAGDKFSGAKRTSYDEPIVQQGEALTDAEEYQVKDYSIF